MNCNRSNRAAPGFTLMELIVGLVVLGVGVTGFLILIHQTTRDSVDPLLRVQANAIAQSYMEEILAQSFCDPNFSSDCPADCESSACTACSIQDASRPDYNDVCDYDGLNDAGARDRNDMPVTGLGDYNVLVSVDDSATFGGLSGTAGQVLRIDVQVTHPAMPGEVELTGYRANY